MNEAMRKRSIDSPIFFIGVPRSGTTIIFEAFSRHRKLGWPSNYTEMAPRWAWLNVCRRLLDNNIMAFPGRKGQYGKVPFGNRYMPRPSEAYKFWDCCTKSEFSRSYLVGVTADKKIKEEVLTAVSTILKWQGKYRFSAKFTGPSRIMFLSSIFPDAKFIHIIRDGRAVVHSLMKVSFWRTKGGYDAPFWKGGLSQSDLEEWYMSSKDPVVLAAIQWKRIIEIARQESRYLENRHYLEFRYERFIESPHTAISKLYEFSGLEDCRSAHEYLDKKVKLVNFNHKYEAELDKKDLININNALQPMLKKLEYI